MQKRKQCREGLEKEEVHCTKCWTKSDAISHYFLKEYYSFLHSHILVKYHHCLQLKLLLACFLMTVKFTFLWLTTGVFL